MCLLSFWGPDTTLNYKTLKTFIFFSAASMCANNQQSICLSEAFVQRYEAKLRHYLHSSSLNFVKSAKKQVSFGNKNDMSAAVSLSLIKFISLKKALLPHKVIMKFLWKFVFFFLTLQSLSLWKPLLEKWLAEKLVSGLVEGGTIKTNLSSLKCTSMQLGPDKCEIQKDSSKACSEKKTVRKDKKTPCASCSGINSM